MEIRIGSVVISKAGRDKGDWFIVIGLEGEYAMLANGDLRKAERPKKKKMKHLQKTNYVSEKISEEMKNVGKVTDSELRKAIGEFRNITC